VKFPALPLALTLFLTLPIGPGFAAPDSDDLVREAVDRLGLQTEMPDQGLGQTGPSTEMSNPRSGPQTDMRDPQVDAPIDKPVDSPASPAAPGFIRYLLWAIVIVGVPVIVWSLRGSLQIIGRSRTIVVQEAASPSQEQSVRMTEARLEADDLARQGRYAEAMHLLLLNSLGEMRRQLGISFALSLTSREILRRVQLPDIGRHALTAIIRSVERTYFGGEDADQDAYSDCRIHFENLKQSLATVAAA
jgi:hypothetical protein